MYIPCSNENSPARLSVRVLEARNLPIMDKSNDTTDAFVEVFLGSQIYKTEICCKNLSPIWNSEEFIFETDEQSLFDNHLSFRIMDHDTYSANDAIGRIFFDVNMLVARIRHSETETYFTEISAWLPIYDTILGLRGELHVYISLKLLVLNATAKYIHVLSTKIIPPHLRIVSILGLLSDIQTISDPEYQWIDRIRSPRASNEARQYIIRKSLRDLARNIARKAYSLGANAIFGYNEFADIEGESTGQISFRVYGTALKLVLCDKEDAVVEKILYPLISLSILPIPYVLGFAAIVCARVVHILEDDDDIDETKKKWWNELKLELLRQAFRLGCNVVISYAEQLTVRGKIALLSCSGSAVSVALTKNSLPVKSCSFFHVPYSSDAVPFNVVLTKCVLCNSGQCADLVISSCCVPTPNLLIGQRLPLQVHVIRKITSPEFDEQTALEISRALPFMEHELYDKIVQEARSINIHFNAIFDLKTFIILSESFILAVASGTVCAIKCLGSRSSVSSAALTDRRLADNRRFSWTSVCDAMRSKNLNSSTSNNSTMILKVIPLRTSLVVAEDGNHRHRGKMEKIVEKFRKKAISRSQFTRIVFERDVGLQMGVVAERESILNNDIAGVHILGTSDKFAVTCEPHQESSHLLNRYTAVFVRETSESVKEMDLDSIIEMVFNDSLISVRNHASAIGCSGLASFSIVSTDFHACRDRVQILLLITGDLLYKTCL